MVRKIACPCQIVKVKRKFQFHLYWEVDTKTCDSPWLVRLQSTRRGFASLRRPCPEVRRLGCRRLGHDWIRPGPICVQNIQIQQAPESTSNGPRSYHVVGGPLTLEFKELMQDNQMSGKETLRLVRLGCKHMQLDSGEACRSWCKRMLQVCLSWCRL